MLHYQFHYQKDLAYWVDCGHKFAWGLFVRPANPSITPYFFGHISYRELAGPCAEELKAKLIAKWKQSYQPKPRPNIPLVRRFQFDA